MLKRIDLKLIQTSSGEELTLKQCVVSGDLITSKDIKTPVSEGDKLVRQLPSGLEEVYQILDVVAYTTILPHYELKVSKL